MANLGPVTTASRTSALLAWAGGVGSFSISGTKATDTTEAIAVFLEADFGEGYKVAGDVIARHIEDVIDFSLGACNVRIRLSGGDAGTSLTGSVDG